ncbi:MAG TPA: peptidylprolyl isomerase [Candidatus Angelobacter sp.]|nr:peptidylprolyl isomerase [Candidatus Angelobacter sp.]
MLKRLALVVLCSTLVVAQTGKKTKSGTAKSPATKAAANPTAIIHTTAGDLKCELFPKEAPKTVANFIGLATGKKDWKDPATGKTMHGKPLYDGVIFHRTIPNFMIQGGDPTGTGSGDVGFTFDDELHPDLLFDKPGRLAMANRGPNTNSSQFFITETELPFLNPCLDPNGCMGGRRAPNSGYTIFGQCDEPSVELVKKIARMPCTMGPCTPNNSKPANPVKITHIEIRNAGRPHAAGAKKKKTGVAKSAPKTSAKTQ